MNEEKTQKELIEDSIKTLKVLQNLEKETTKTKVEIETRISYLENLEPKTIYGEGYTNGMIFGLKWVLKK